MLKAYSKLILATLLMTTVFANCRDDAWLALDEYARRNELSIELLSQEHYSFEDVSKRYTYKGKVYFEDFDPEEYPQGSRVYVALVTAWSASAEDVIVVNSNSCEVLGIDRLWSE